MQYQTVANRIQVVEDVQKAVAACITLSQARDGIVRRRNETHSGRRWSCAFHGPTAIFVSQDSGAILAMDAGEEVLAVSRDGLVLRFVPGPWVPAVITLAEWVTTDEATPATSSRCPHYAAIKRAFAFATQRGLDTKDDAAWRLALSDYFDRPITTRRSLTGSEWWEVGNAIRDYQLSW
jgi:hypothetical protein